MDTETKPLPTVRLDEVRPDSAPVRPLRRHPVAIAVTLALGIIAAAVILLNWQAILTALLTLLFIVFLGLIAVCVLFRIATGGRLGAAALGALIATLVARRR